MSDMIIATMFLLGGLGWSALIFFSMMSHPTGGTDFPQFSFFTGLAAAAFGLFMWVIILLRWVL